MRKFLLVAGLAAAALIPSLASAQTSCGQQRDNQVVGTVAGAGIGALIGSAVAPRGDRGAGAVIGAVGGGVIGNQATRPGADCAHAYGYYDRTTNGTPTRRSRRRPRLLRSRRRLGRWRPERLLRWRRPLDRGQQDGAADGYYDSRGRWIPASANGYYDDSGQWVSSESGYYDRTAAGSPVRPTAPMTPTDTG